jgi:Na+-driven multidrug efflux pump
LIIKLLEYSSSSEEEFNYILAEHNIYLRICSIIECIVIGFGMGYLPAASYANAAGNQKRFLRLKFHLI